MTIRNCANGQIITTTNEIDQIVQEILEDMSLKEKAESQIWRRMTFSISKISLTLISVVNLVRVTKWAKMS
jgi:hypothetical protein